MAQANNSTGHALATCDGYEIKNGKLYRNKSFKSSEDLESVVGKLVLQVVPDITTENFMITYEQLKLANRVNAFMIGDCLIARVRAICEPHCEDTGYVKIGSWEGGGDSGAESVNELASLETYGVDPLSEFEEETLRELADNVLGYGSYAGEYSTSGEILYVADGRKVSDESMWEDAYGSEDESDEEFLREGIHFVGNDTSDAVEFEDPFVSFTFPFDDSLVRWGFTGWEGWQLLNDLDSVVESPEDYITSNFDMPNDKMTPHEAALYSRILEVINQLGAYDDHDVGISISFENDTITIAGAERAENPGESVYHYVTDSYSNTEENVDD